MERLPRGHALAGRATVTATELRRDPAFAERCPPMGLDEMLDRVALGRLIAVVGSAAGERLTPEVCAVPVTDLPATTLALGWLEHTTRHSPRRGVLIRPRAGVTWRSALWRDRHAPRFRPVAGSSPASCRTPA
ncbi:hypothetical protein JBE27_23080 [Streptomyces albiflaviniger]|nr:hypothetical protein [Streptomyces albiflaviniger]